MMDNVGALESKVAPGVPAGDGSFWYGTFKYPLVWVVPDARVILLPEPSPLTKPPN